MYRIFGREPALWLGLAAVILKVLSAFVWHVSVDNQALINAALAAAVGILVALSVHDGISAAVLGFAQATIALAVGFGLHLSSDNQALLMSLVTAVVAMWTRTQVTAKVTAAQLRLAA